MAEEHLTTRGYQDDFYNLCAKMRDRENRLWKAEKIAYALTSLRRDGLNPLSTERCVDVGCSSGVVSNRLAGLFGSMVGIEYDEVAMRNLDAPWAPTSRFVRGDAMALPVASESIDVVVCSQVYEHVPNDERLFAEIFRILKPGGTVFFSGPNRLFPYEFHYSLPLFHWLPRSLADLTLRLLRRGDHFYENLRTIWSLRRALKRFEIQDVTVDLLIRNPRVVVTARMARLIGWVPEWAWRAALPFFPNFNMLLYKPHR